jgi:hypothetical protein
MVLEELMSSRGQSTGFLSGKSESPQKKSISSPVSKPSATTSTPAVSAPEPIAAAVAAAVMSNESISASRSSEF